GSAVGINLEEFSPERFDAASRRIARKKFGVAADVFVLAYVGRPAKRKGFNLLLNAWEKSDLGARRNLLLIAGCTQTECERAAGRPIDGVRGLGYLTDLKEFYAGCDAVVLPSNHEGF